jgi:hypothetical protein
MENNNILLRSQLEIEPQRSRSLLSNAVQKYFSGRSGWDNETEIWNYRVDTILFAVSAVSSVIYIASMIVAAVMVPAVRIIFSDYILMFLLGVVLSLDAYIFSGTISSARVLSLNGKSCVAVKALFIIIMCIYFSLTGPHDNSVMGFLNCLHNFVTVTMFLPSVLTHEFEIYQVALFFDSVDKQPRFDMNGKVNWSDDLKIYDSLVSKRPEFELVARVSSYSLFLALIISISICLVYTAFNLGFRTIKSEGPIPYVAHYILVFSATEGLIRRASNYNDRMSELTRLIRFESTFLIKILSFEPSGLLLLSFYLSFLSLSVRLLFDDSV